MWGLTSTPLQGPKRGLHGVTQDISHYTVLHPVASLAGHLKPALSSLAFLLPRQYGQHHSPGGCWDLLSSSPVAHSPLGHFNQTPLQGATTGPYILVAEAHLLQAGLVPGFDELLLGLATLSEHRCL